LLNIGFYSFAQNQVMGFACGPSTFPTTVVSDFGKLIIDGKYDEIKNELTSLDPGEQFLAVVVLEELVTIEQITLSRHDIARIKTIKKSKSIVETCSGVDPNVEYRLKDLLKKKKQHYILKYTKFWFNECLKKQKAKDF